MTMLPEIYFLEGHELELTADETEAIPQLLGAAALAVTAPRQSGYAVQTAAINGEGNVVHGGNREYGLSRAYVHGEEAVVSKLFSEYPDIPLLGLGFYAEGDTPQGMLPCPCGNCRDVLREEASPDLLLAAGNSRIAVVTRLAMCLQEAFQSADPAEILQGSVLQRAFKSGHRAYQRAAIELLPPERKGQVYGVALVDNDGIIYPGSFDTTAGYDAITPGVAAIQAFRNRSGQGELTNLQAILVVGAGDTLPDPCYRDRNALSELSEVLQSGDADTPAVPIYIMQSSEDGTPLRAAVTDTHEWLPFPFTYRSLGIPKAAQTKRYTLAKYL